LENLTIVEMSIFPKYLQVQDNPNLNPPGL
jgi:hypothetical protein